MRKIQCIFIYLTAILFLAACGKVGDKQQTDFSDWENAALEYSYPDNGQTEVPLHAPVVLRFSNPITSETPENELTFTTGGQAVAFSLEMTDDARSLVLTPDAALDPATTYILSAGQLESDIGTVKFPENGITFTTRVAKNGPADRITADASSVTGTAPFQVARMIPDGSELPLMDFSTLRLQFTQPMDIATVAYGSTVSLEDDQGNLVPVNLVTSAAYMTIDPVDDLTPGAIYHLRLTSGISSIAGNALAPGDYGDLTFQPKDSSPRETLVQKAPASDDDEAGQCTGDCRYVSPLTGMPINCVPIKAVLLGDEGNNTQQTGDVHAELAFAPNYPDITPLRVPRGSLLTGTAMEVYIGGLVPAGFGTDDISVKFITDASGYLVPNPYSNSTSAPKQIRLYMDIAMNTAGAEANGGLSQDLLHVTLVGTSIVEDGIMVINAVGVIEPKVLGLEEAYGILSFRMESYRDQVNAPEMEIDTTPPAIQSWLPGSTENAKSLRTGDPIIVNFSEALDRNSIRTAIDNGKLTLNSGTDFTWYLDGATLVIRPDNGLTYGTTYALQISRTGGITDIAGNTLSADRNLTFTMPYYVENGSDSERSPIVLTAYPGYPNANTVGTDSSLLTTDVRGNLYQGRSAGGESDDDLLPVMDLPADRPIVVMFSQVMNTDTIVAGESFVVQSSDDGGATWSSVDGRLEKLPRQVSFYPEISWEDGILYRYILASDESNAEISGTITDSRGNPLQTRILSPPKKNNKSTAPDPTDGGPPLVNYFHGAPVTEAVFQVLRNFPTIDVNSNFIYDGRQPDDDESGCTNATCEDVSDPEPGYIVEENATKIVATGAGGLAGKAKTGCPFSETCPEKEFIWLTGGLNVEVVGPAEYTGFGDYTGQAIKVHIFPTRVMTSNLDVYMVASLFGIDLMELHTPSGPQIMRVRYEADSRGNRTQPVTGWIRPDENGNPIFETGLDLYLDAPYLEPGTFGIVFAHNMHSYELHLNLRGNITFFEDGRMNIEQISTNATPINIVVGAGMLEGSIIIDLEIPEGGAFMNYIQGPLKE